MFECRGIPGKAPSPVIYLSGFISKDKGMSAKEEVRILASSANVKYRCFSHAFCCKGGVHHSKHVEETLKESIPSGMRVMMDSGAFSFHQAQRKLGKVGKKTWTPEELVGYREQVVASYVDFCRKYSNQWDFYITFDYKIHAPTVYEMTKRLQALGMRPAPVFHGDADISWLERYCKEGHKIICIGGSRVIAGRSTYRGIRNYYDIVFNTAEKYGVQLHALAQTATSFMFQYPWASVDSATWARVASHGSILNLNPQTGQVGPIHVSERHSDNPCSYNRLPKHGRREIEKMVEAEGFEFAKLRTSPFWRSIFNAKMFSTKIMDWKEITEKGRVEWATLI